MEGEYIARRVTCQGCRAGHLEQDAHGHLKPAEAMFVVDQTPDGYEPDPRQAPSFGD